MDRKNALILIIVISALLRLISLSSGDTVNDEVFMAFRGIGMLDFDEAKIQTTPIEWLDSSGGTPWWTNLSFHDHPLLVPYVQHIFMNLFGDNVFAFRLPSAILGTISVYLLYLIGTLLYTENIGLIAAAIFGISLNNIYISRVGMQEAYVIFLMLLAIYFFLKSLQPKAGPPRADKNGKFLLWTGIVLGLGLLAKYTTFILVPIFITYLLIYRRDYFSDKNFWLATAISIAIFSPVIIYNVMLYKTTGYFDLQVSYIIDKVPEAWKNAPGKEIGTLADRIRDFIPRLINSNSWVFLSVVAMALIAFLISLLKSFKEALKKNGLLLIVSCWLLILLLKIGPSYRFLTMLTPFFALSAAIFLNSISSFCQNSHSNVLKNVRMIQIFWSFIAILIAFELFYSINNQIISYPKGPFPWLASKIRYENYNWGYNELGNYLEKELAGKVPALTFDLTYKFLEPFREKALNEGMARGFEPYPALIVYDGNFDRAGRLWNLDRLHIYHAWPVLSIEEYFGFLKQNGFDYYEKSGFQIRYFVVQNNFVLSDADKMLMRGEKIPILNKRGEEAFTIYKSNR